jgi:hypothetical protein
MAKSNNKIANDKVRDEFINNLMEWLKGEDVQKTKNNEVAFPFVNELGADEWLRITIAIPTGGRDGEQFDGYELAKELIISNAEKEKVAIEKEIKKQKKIVADKKRREIIAKQKEEESQ